VSGEPTVEPAERDSIPISERVDAPTGPSSEEWTPPRAPFPFAKKKSAPTVRTSDDDDAPTRLVDVEVVERRRRTTGIENLDRLLGGGIVESEGVIYSAWGDGGAGKSTLLTEVIARDARRDHAVLYGSGEEPKERVRLRAESFGIGLTKNFFIEEGRDLDRIERIARRLSIRMMVLDSLQVYVPEEHKMKPALVRLLNLARDLSAIFFIINHARADGGFYGTNAIKHEFDGVLKFERQVIKPFRGEPILTPIVHVRHDTKHRLTSGVGSSPEGKPARYRWQSIDVPGLEGTDRPGYLRPLSDDPKDDPSEEDEPSSTSIRSFGSV
jgi:hypothetical protein